jgi:hypothetical protein
LAQCAGSISDVSFDDLDVGVDADVFVGGNLAGVTDRRKEQEPMDSDVYPRAEWKLLFFLSL